MSATPILLRLLVGDDARFELPQDSIGIATEMSLASCAMVCARANS